MPRFTVKDLLIAIALIAVGAGALAFLLRGREGFFGGGLGSEAAVLVLWIGGGASIGAGLLTPFKRPLVGAVIGMVIQTISSTCLVFVG
jgi:hypothetical protein